MRVPSRITDIGTLLHWGPLHWGPLALDPLNVQKMTHWKGGKSAFGAGLLPKRTDPPVVRLTGDVLDWRFPRVEHAEKVIHNLIVAASYDSTEEAAADSRFAQIFMASAFPDQDGDALIPACKVVIAQFERLERHHQEAGMN